MDHHEVTSDYATNPAFAHLNPKVFSLLDENLTNLCAAGFTFLFCEQFAKDESITNWNRNRSLILAGLGTLADVMLLVGTNRALVKHSLILANREEELDKIPGLVALKNISESKEVKSYTYAFQWGPRLNAVGRIDHASASVNLLLSNSLDQAEPHASLCEKTNQERQAMQEDIVEEATEQAQVLANLGHKVLVIVGKGWHSGIVGIVASKIKEAFNRPTIVCGWHEEDKCWKGSGRSVEGFDLGGAVDSAKGEGIAFRGGGHKMACGVSFYEDKVNELRDYMNNICPLTKADFVPNYMVLGRSLDQHPDSWIEIYRQLEPFGNGNPTPLLYFQGKLMWSGEKRTRDEERVWGVSGGFKSDIGPDKLQYYLWTDVERAMREWNKGSEYQMVVKVRKSEKDYSGKTRVFYNWYVENCDMI